MAKKNDGPFDVEATATGYYGSKIRDPGERFSILRASDFSDAWMKKVEAKPADEPVVVDGSQVDPTSGGKTAPADGDLTDEEKIGLAKEITGRDDIKTVAEADEILKQAEPSK